MKIIELETIDSTNEYCKRVDTGEDLLVTAERQSAGKGTKGRSFISESGGLYISVMRHFTDFPAADAFRIMINSCVSVCRTLEFFGIPATIRWANDVLVDNKKICGTLIENTFSGAFITRSVVGSGLNVNNEISPQIKDVAISMKEYSGKNFDIAEVKRVFTDNLKKHFTIDDYKSYINWLGSKVILKTDEKETEVKALDVSPSGRLIVDWCGNILEISSAEVSLRL